MGCCMVNPPENSDYFKNSGNAQTEIISHLELLAGLASESGSSIVMFESNPTENDTGKDLVSISLDCSKKTTASHVCI